jgi:hypothetical protein
MPYVRSTMTKRGTRRLHIPVRRDMGAFRPCAGTGVPPAHGRPRAHEPCHEIQPNLFIPRAPRNRNSTFRKTLVERFSFCYSLTLSGLVF